MEVENKFKLIYWQGFPGRGEFIRLPLEATGTPYEDIANNEEVLKTINEERQLNDKEANFAVPLLDHDGFRLADTSAILAYLGQIIGFAPRDEKGRAKVNQLQLAVADLVLETFNSYRPLSRSSPFESQKGEAIKRSREFIDDRIPKYLNFFERQISANGNEPWLYGDSITYADTSLFQVLDGLFYSYPKSLTELKGRAPKVFRLYDAVRNHEKIKAYLASERRQKYSNGVFKHYPELDVSTSVRNE